MKYSVSSWVLICLLTQISFAQNESYQFELFTANLDGSKLSVITLEENFVFEKEFSDPISSASDLDEDGIDELLIVDSIQNNSNINFILYVFNTLDTFYLVDSIASGSSYPYETTSDMFAEQEGEIEGVILVCGNPSFDIFNSGAISNFLPVNCYKFEEAEIFPVNEEIYNVFLNENENIISYLDEFYNSSGKNCESSVKLKSAIASAYANYINAGEESVATQFLKNYYLCDDIEEFKDQINELLNEGSE